MPKKWLDLLQTENLARIAKHPELNALLSKLDGLKIPAPKDRIIATHEEIRCKGLCIHIGTWDIELDGERLSFGEWFEMHEEQGVGIETA